MTQTKEIKTVQTYYHPTEESKKSDERLMQPAQYESYIVWARKANDDPAIR